MIIPNKIVPSHSNPMPLRLGKIGYVNVAPVYYGLDHEPVPPWLCLVDGPPSTLNQAMCQNALDVSPVSSAAYALHQDQWLLLPDLAIACRGKVMSVLLVSRCPLDELDGRRILLTPESATAAALIRLLLKSRGIHPRYTTGRLPCPPAAPTDAAAALIIGDTALRAKWETELEHVFDVGEMWQRAFGLPFVFALWAVRRSYFEAHPDMVAAVARLLQESRSRGARHRARIIVAAAQRLGLSTSCLQAYYRCLNYHLESPEIEGLEAFFSGLYRHGLIPEPVTLNFVAGQHRDRHHAA